MNWHRNPGVNIWDEPLRGGKSKALEQQWTSVICSRRLVHRRLRGQSLTLESTQMQSAIDTTPVSDDPTITTLFGPRKSARVTPDPSPGSALKNFGRFLGRALVASSMLLFLLSGYLAFNHYWVQTRWTKSEATVLSGEIRQRSSGSTSRAGSVGTSSKTYFVHCTVTYPVAGEIRQSQLDAPGSPYSIDAQVWASSWLPGQHIAIQYNPSNPGKIRLVDNPDEVTAMGSLRVAVYFFLPGMLLVLAGRSDRGDSEKSNVQR